MYNNRAHGWLPDEENTTDIEVAMNIVRLMNGYIESVKAQGNGYSRSIYIKMAKNSLETMTNPYAKKLLLDKIEDVKCYT